MAQVIWTEPAVTALDAIADFIALENPEAARALVRKVHSAVLQLKRFPRSVSRIPEAPRRQARQFVAPPCRVFYRPGANLVIILYVIRSEQLFRSGFLS